MASKNWVLARLENIIGPAVDAFGNIDEIPAGQPVAGFVYADDGNFYETIEEALNNATAYVRIGEGTYNENITITTEGLVLEAGSETTIIDGGSSGPAVTIDASDVSLADVEVKTSTGSGEPALSVTDNGDISDIIKVDVIEAGADGITSDSGAEEVEVKECRVETADGRSIDLAGPNCRIEACYSLGPGVDDGLRTEGDDSSIISSYALNHGNEAIEVDGDHCRCNNNTVQGAGDRGIIADGDHCTVNDNTVENSTDDGIEVNGDDCTANNNTVDSAGNDGIELNGKRCTANGNTIAGAGDNGIDMQGDDCTANDNTVSNSTDDGIRVNGTDQVVVGNRVGGSGDDDIDTGGATDQTVANNNTGSLN